MTGFELWPTDGTEFICLYDGYIHIYVCIYVFGIRCAFGRAMPHLFIFGNSCMDRRSIRELHQRGMAKIKKIYIVKSAFKSSKAFKVMPLDFKNSNRNVIDIVETW